jgi:hypothetical protein
MCSPSSSLASRGVPCFLPRVGRSATSLLCSEASLPLDRRPDSTTAHEPAHRAHQLLDRRPQGNYLVGPACNTRAHRSRLRPAPSASTVTSALASWSSSINMIASPSRRSMPMIARSTSPCGLANTRRASATSTCRGPRSRPPRPRLQPACPHGARACGRCPKPYGGSCPDTLPHTLLRTSQCR